NSATSGLFLSLEALGVGPGDRVATSTYTFTSSAAVARHLGAEVVFCDIAPEDYNIDPRALEAALKREKRVKAVVAVHVGGLPCRIAEIGRIASRSGAAVVEDSAHAFPSRLGEGFIGTLGDAGVYSFYATKTIASGDGGMVVARSEAVRARIATMRMHGFDRAAWDRYTSKSASWRYDVVEAGFKCNLPDLLAAIGREQLRKADIFLEQRREIASTYMRAFAGHRALELPPVHDAHSWHLFSLRLRPGTLSIGRDEFIERLSSRGCGTSVHFIPLHTMTYWARRYSLSPGDFPEALDKFSRTISLPIWHGMTTAQVERVALAVLDVAKEAAA
ncbi:MAG: DegT/DnrJ/EryC1/StrS family aminotransferase, partial [Spirochaetaceae bacterium]|nr:DegT/DnrJ/EryC1/StrS family aminotransferase [Spirochaetaceae bacterium]